MLGLYWDNGKESANYYTTLNVLLTPERQNAPWWESGLPFDQAASSRYPFPMMLFLGAEQLAETSDMAGVELMISPAIKRTLLH